MATTLASDATALAIGVLPAAAAGGCSLGANGPWIFDFHNNAGSNVDLAVWGANSWLNKFNPAILVTLEPGGMTTVSFANGFSGAFAGIFPDTDMRMGQINNTWGELTTGSGGVVDVSREVNMDGHGLKIVSPTGCVSDTAGNTCAFICYPADGNSCWQNYQLIQSSNPNCIKGYDPVMNGVSGGCSLGQTTSGNVVVTFYD
jgi:hypothetical protein